MAAGHAQPGRRTGGGTRARGAPGSGVALVSDIDDTVMVTALPRPLPAAWNSLVLHENARMVVPGMADLYRRWRGAHPKAPTFYLSTGAFGWAPRHRRYRSAIPGTTMRAFSCSTRLFQAAGSGRGSAVTITVSSMSLTSATPDPGAPRARVPPPVRRPG